MPRAGTSFVRVGPPISNIGSATLADTASLAISTTVWTTWGAAQTITVPARFQVLAGVTGDVANSSASSGTALLTRASYSLDGGTTFTAGSSPKGQAGTSAGAALSLPVLAVVDTGLQVLASGRSSIQVKAEVQANSGSTGAVATAGTLFWIILDRSHG